jgi:hypothetical protein
MPNKYVSISIDLDSMQEYHTFYGFPYNEETICAIWDLGPPRITIHRMNREIDRGPILAQKKIPNRGTFFGIYHDLYELACHLLIDILNGNEDLNKTVCPDRKEYSYYSYPTFHDRQRFYRQKLRIGWPLRIK